MRVVVNMLVASERSVKHIYNVHVQLIHIQCILRIKLRTVYSVWGKERGVWE